MRRLSILDVCRSLGRDNSSLLSISLSSLPLMALLKLPLRLPLLYILSLLYLTRCHIITWCVRWWRIVRRCSLWGCTWRLSMLVRKVIALA